VTGASRAFANRFKKVSSRSHLDRLSDLTACLLVRYLGGSVAGLAGLLFPARLKDLAAGQVVQKGQQEEEE
jgi:hypothetical protein